MRRPNGSYLKVTVPPEAGSVTLGQPVLKVPGIGGGPVAISLSQGVAVVVVGEADIGRREQLVAGIEG